MKSIKSIIEEKKKLTDRRDVICSGGEISKEEKKELSSARKRISFLYLCEMYLSSFPSEEYLKSEIERLTGIVSVLNERIQEVNDLRSNGKISKETESEKINDIQKPYKVSHIRKQISSIRFLLK